MVIVPVGGVLSDLMVVEVVLAEEVEVVADIVVLVDVGLGPGDVVVVVGTGVEDVVEGAVVVVVDAAVVVAEDVVVMVVVTGV